jgi:hypothetical protein
MSTLNDDAIGQLIALQRNNYFFGKLMDQAQFEKEQRYVMSKQALINRFILGTGVACGLDVVSDPDDETRVLVQSGMALDGLGRQVVVEEAVSIDPHQPTNEQGQPDGDPLVEGTVEICLAYAEMAVEPIPVMVPDCGTDGNCAPSTVREDFHLLVRLVEGDSPPPPTCLAGESPLPANGALHELLCERSRTPCPAVPEDSCVPLGRVTLPLEENSIDACAGRPLVYSNAVLYELIVCLAAQINMLSPGRELRIVSGDGQIGAPGELLDDPLVVEMVDAEGNPISGEIVQFQVRVGNGSVSQQTVQTDPDGRAETEWTLGAEEGEQQVIARAVGSLSTVSWQATAAAA